MTRTLSFIGVAALGATLVAVGGCKLAAGVKDHPNPTGAAGDTGAAGAGTAGTVGGGAAGAGGSGGTTSPINVGNQYLNTAGTNGQTGPCQARGCQQSTCRGAGCTVTCPAGQRTTVSGTIFDPAGQTPLYNITVYVPNADLDPISDGPSCDPCDPSTGTSLLSGKPVVITKTDTLGKFMLGANAANNVGGDVPAGTNVPLVIQVGKWQRQVVLPTVTACMDNPITDMSLLHLPRTKAEGHIPRMALTTGGSDAMECLLRKIGIDDTEFTTDSGMGRVNLFAGGGGGASSFVTAPATGGATFTPSNPWWDSYDNLAKYDIILHSCEGGGGSYNPMATPPTEPTSVKSIAARMALEKFADMGGRVFASHWHAYWFEESPGAFKTIGTFFHHPDGLPNPYESTIDQSFPTGMALAQWLIGPQVMGSTTLGTVTIAQDASNRLIDAATGGTISQRWIYADTFNPKSVQFLSATTPIAASPTAPGGTCGRAVVSDLHVSAGGNGSDVPKMPFPSGCVTTTLSPREKVLEFMMFDIASCVAPPVP